MVEFADGKATIKSQGRVAAIGYRKGGLYWIDFQRPSTEVHSATSLRPNDLWHRRLGHLGVQNVQRLRTMVDGV